MTWPKGVPRPSKDRQAISQGLLGLTVKPSCVICGNPCRKKTSTACSKVCQSQIPMREETKEKLRQYRRPQSLATRQRIGAASKEHWQNPEYREKVVSQLVGVDNWRGGQGRPPIESELEYARLLCPLGYTHNHIIGAGKGQHGHWTIDFALLENLIAIEIDGSSHRKPDRIARDRRKDEYLRSLGWKVIRIKV